jgi:ribose transport system substrate-binding protein
MRTRRLTTALLGAALVLVTAACGETVSTAGPPTVAIVAKGFQHQFWQAVRKGAEQEAAKEKVRVTFEGPATESDIEGQVRMLNLVLGRRPAALGFAALDSKAAAPLLDEAKSRNIPVVAFDSGVDSDLPLTTAATDNKAAAAEAAKHMAEAIGGTGKVALVVHDQISRSGVDRRDGFIEWMKANAPGVQLLDTQYGSGDKDQSAAITASIIAANPDLKGIYGTNEGSAIGIARGVVASGRTGLAVIGFDSGKDQIDAIRNGTMLGAITQNPIGIGEQTVAAAVKAIKGEELPKVIDTGFFWYDKNNIDTPQIQAVIYQ